MLILDFGIQWPSLKSMCLLLAFLPYFQLSLWITVEATILLPCSLTFRIWRFRENRIEVNVNHLSLRLPKVGLKEAAEIAQGHGAGSRRVCGQNLMLDTCCSCHPHPPTCDHMGWFTGHQDWMSALQTALGGVGVENPVLSHMRTWHLIHHSHVLNI